VSKTTATREPQQSRSRATKEKILDAAYKLFSEKGYYQTTTNHIARAAGLSIGSLYAYYKDREEILSDLLVRFDSSLNKALDELSDETQACRSDIHAWIRLVIERMTRLQEAMKALNKQLRSLRYTSPKVDKVLRQQRNREIGIINTYLTSNRTLVAVEDLETAAFIVLGLIEVAVDEMVFSDDGRDHARILEATVQAICSYLFK